MFKDVLWNDWLKLRNYIQIRLIILITPLFLTVVGVANYVTHIHVFEENGMVGWTGAWTQVEFLYGTVLCPLLSSVYLAILCRFEHANGGWKQLLSYPIPKVYFYLSKMIWGWLLVGMTNVMMFLYFLILGKVMGVTGTFPYFEFFVLFLNGWLSILPLIALQTWLAIQWQNFSLPIALNFAFIIPNIFVTGSKYGRYYPWSQPAYAMTPENQLGFTQTTQDLYLAVIGGFLLFSLVGVWNFMRTEMK
ncbi:MULTISPECIES: ABC transporter permease [Bacillus cereus group]|uniref:ABC transporter permease n=1 Tax=Bacillus cereus group TaxID=86661 RepID=UPI002E21861A|nr:MULTISPECIES: ABC transporter permease [Bacillus cereus group]MED1512718.1 ABC transporter permease [Bacillus proteolyticus]MED1554725.1 ABC transporter permease [Bacillus paramycoides]